MSVESFICIYNETHKTSNVQKHGIPHDITQYLSWKGYNTIDVQDDNGKKNAWEDFIPYDLTLIIKIFVFPRESRLWFSLLGFVI
jgi:hypothetical protein